VDHHHRDRVSAGGGHRQRGIPADFAQRDAESWPRAQKFGGPPTPVFIFRSVAASSWSVDRGFSVQPAELAAYLIKTGHARAAHPDEMPKAE
jgi:hypothetical protein